MQYVSASTDLRYGSVCASDTRRCGGAKLAAREGRRRGGRFNGEKWHWGGGGVGGAGAGCDGHVVAGRARQQAEPLAALLCHHFGEVLLLQEGLRTAGHPGAVPRWRQHRSAAILRHSLLGAVGGVRSSSEDVGRTRVVRSSCSSCGRSREVAELRGGGGWLLKEQIKSISALMALRNSRLTAWGPSRVAADRRRLRLFPLVSFHFDHPRRRLSFLLPLELLRT